MPIFGAYETVTELSRGAICSVWTARRGAGAAAGMEGKAGPVVYAIKVCQPDIDIAGLEQAQLAVQVFLEQVDAQRRLAELPNAVWIPVHDSGRIDAGGAGAYYVTDTYPRGSLERLVTSRTRPDPKALYAIVSGVLAGIRQIRDFLRRPHGNIHAGNVLVVGDTGGATEMRVLLADPAAQSQIRGRTDAAGDLRALGALLYQLVTHQEYHERSGWPLAESADWKRIPGGERWRALCNRLLDPNPGSPPTVEEIEQTLLNLGAQSGKGKGKLIAIGAAALVLVAGGVAAVMMTRKPTPPPVPIPAVTPENWATLVDEYDSWFAAFASAASRLDEARVRALGERAPEFKAWLPALRGGLAKDDPWEIAGVAKSVSLSDLKKNPPAMVAGSDAAKATNDLLEVIKGIRTSLSTGEWSLAKETAGVTSAWQARGWDAPAQYVSKTGGLVKPDAELIQQAGALIVVLDKAAQVEKSRAATDVVVRHIEDETKKLGGDKVLGSFRAWADGYPGRQAEAAEPAAVLDALAAGIEKVRGAATAVGQFLDSPARANVCFDELGKSDIYAKFAVAQAGPEVFEDWANEAKKQRYANPSPAEDPRAGKDIVEPTTRMAQELEKLKKNGLPPTSESLMTLDALGAALGAGGSAGADPAAKLASIRERAQALKGLAWDCRTRQQIEVVRYDAVLQQMDDVARAWRTQNAAKEGNIRAELTRIEKANVLVRDSETVNAWWVERRTAIFREPDEAARYEKASDLEARLTALDAAVPRWTAPAATGREGAWVRGLERAAVQQRDSTIGNFLRSRAADAKWSDGDRHAVAEAYTGWTTSLGSIVATTTAIERLLNAGYGLADVPPGGKSVDTLAGEVTGPVADQVKDALTPVMARVEALRLLARATTPSQIAPLVTQDASNRPELTLAAWRKLGQLEGSKWPATAADLEMESRAFPAALRAVTKPEVAGERAGALSKEIADGRQNRWESFVKRAATEADLNLALDSERTISQLEVDPSKATDQMVRYRLAAHELKKAIAVPGVTDQQTKAAVEKFAASVPGDLAGDARVAPMLDGLAKAVSDAEEAPKVDPKRLGPGSLAAGGWNVEEAGGQGTPSILRFTKDRLKLEFVRVEAGAGVPDAFYLGTDEISVGQFASIIDTVGAAGWQSILTLMPTAEDPPVGPRAWRWAAGRGNDPGKVSPVTEWIQTSRPSVGAGEDQKPAYAPGFGRADGKAMIPEMAPRPTSPMQFVSPAAAVYAASVVACRLPSPAEWQLAAASGAPVEAMLNLRDKAWQTQLEYVKTTRRQMSAVQDQFLFPDAGSFPVTGAGVGEAAAVAADAADDKTLWFAQVVEGATGFAHLRGNVAEYVVSGPGEALATTDARAASDFASKRARDIAVIGASALSPPEMVADRALPVPESDAMGGWSDVGFRLAFSGTGTRAPRRSKAEIVTALLTDAGADPYLLKK